VAGNVKLSEAGYVTRVREKKRKNNSSRGERVTLDESLSEALKTQRRSLLKS